VRAWKKDALEVRSAVIHELLHSLGLGETPTRTHHKPGQAPLLVSGQPLRTRSMFNDERLINEGCPASS
jgi:hypothetical protein